MSDYSPDQAEAIRRIDLFLAARNPPRKYFSLQGLAGTGKSKVLADLARRYDALLLAPTGKAASVLSRRTGLKATTIHSGIYAFRGEFVDEETGERNLSFKPRITDGAWRRKIAFVDECFVRGTLIDTPEGSTTIELLRQGDTILNAVGKDRIVRTSQKEVDSVVQLKTGTDTITCSRDHPFFTQRGLVCAEQLRPADALVTLPEAMRLLRKNCGTGQKRYLVKTVLQQELLNALDAGSAWWPRTQVFARFQRESREKAARLVTFRTSESKCGNRANTSVKPHRKRIYKDENKSSVTSYEMGTSSSGRKRMWTYCATKIHVGHARSRLDCGIFRGERKTENSRSGDSLCDRHSKSDRKNSNRNRWRIAPIVRSAEKRQRKKCATKFKRVDSVEVLQSTDSRLDGVRNANGRICLYDITCEQHHSFSVSGILVHNCSMVDATLAMDLLATGCKVVAAGDPGQLQPVRGTRFFDHADATLTTIHRQALESAIVRQAHNVRHSGTYQADGPDFRVQRFVEREDILAADIFLCWRNNTRHMLNALVRAHRGLEGYPVAGEPVMCLRNDHDVGILNGAVYRLLRDYDHRRKVARIKNERDEIIDVERCRIEQMDPPGHVDDASEEHPFAFAGAATVHKFQGSETDTGILVDEYDRQDQRREFLYTGMTRFSKQVIVQRNF